MKFFRSKKVQVTFAVLAIFAVVLPILVSTIGGI